MSPYVHYCVVKDGSAAGNKAAIEVSQFDIEYQEKCDHCGEPLAPIEKVVAYLYGVLVI